MIDTEFERLWEANESVGTIPSNGTNFICFAKRDQTASDYKIPPQSMYKAARKQLFRSVRNVLVNEMGLSKELVREVLYKMLDEYVARYLKSPEFEYHIKDILTKALRSEYGSNYPYKGRDFEAVVANEMRKKIGEVGRQVFQERFDLEISVKPKGE